MDIYQQYNQEIIQLWHDLATFVHTYDDRGEMSVKMLDEAVEQMKRGQLLVAVCGEFKQGKTSLINAFLDEPGLLPVDSDIATNALSVVSFGSEENYVVMLNVDGKEVSKVIHRAEIADYVSERYNERNEKQVRLLTVELPNVRLQDGLVLIDTPGIGGLQADLSDIAYTLLPKADVVLFVSAITHPLQPSELAFLQHLRRHCQHILYVFTYIDNLIDYEVVLQANRHRLAQALDQPEQEIQIVAVSNLQKLSYLQSKKPEELARSNFPGLEEVMGSFLKDRGRIVLVQTLMRFKFVLREMLFPLEIELRASQQTSEEERQRLASKWKVARTRLKELTDRQGRWRIKFEQRIEATRKYILEKFEHGFVELREKFALDIDNPDLLDTPTEIFARLKQNIYEVMLTQDEILEQKVAELFELTQQETQLSIRVALTPSIGRVSLVTFYAENIHVARKTLWEKFQKACREQSTEQKSGE